MPAIAAGLVATVPWGRRRRITAEEFERLEREGIGGKRNRRRLPSVGGVAGSTAGSRPRLTYSQARGNR